MPIDLYEASIPNLITWFNGFVGYHEIHKRTLRVEEKLKTVDFAVPALNRRFAFHTTYKTIVLRNRRFQKVNVDELETNRALSLIAGVREASKVLDDRGKSELRARVIGALDPSSDIRQLEHEIRVFVHYRQAGLKVQFVDLEKEGRFDLLVTGPKGLFEVECKTISENIGSAISLDESFKFFRAFKRVVEGSRAMNVSGIVTLTIPGKMIFSEDLVFDWLSRFVAFAPQKMRESNFHLRFDRKPNWDICFHRGDRESVVSEIALHHEATNPHAMVVLSRSRAILFCVGSERLPRPFRYIFDGIKTASEQFSKARPGVIWVHFLGLTENGFMELLAPRDKNKNTPFHVLGIYAFRSSKRKHVCRLRLSADPDDIRINGYQHLLAGRSRMISTSGPAYDLTSVVSEFDAALTEERVADRK